MTRDGSCIPWEGTIRPDGYGQCYIDGKPQLAHRVAWMQEHGAYPDYPHEVIDHLCRDRACVNVEHMELTTIGGNVLRGEGISAVNKAKVRCSRGQDDWKVYGGKRTCMECSRARRRARRAGLDWGGE